VIEDIWVGHGNRLIRVVLGHVILSGGGGLWLLRFQEVLGKSASEGLVIVRSVMVPEKILNSW
jgi:hypothetical protein